MAQKRIGRTIKPYFEKARDAALLAVEVYNKPAVKFKSSAYITLMVMAWTALLHAIAIRAGKKPYHKGKNGRYIKIDGDYKHWELAECAADFWHGLPDDPVRKNVEFFIPLRNKIEHRHLPALDNAVFGECQALLLNFDEVLGKHFGESHQLRESLSFSLQLFPSGESFAQAIKGNKDLSEVKRFIDNYRNMLGAEAAASGQFAFKAFLIQVANHASQDTLPVQFVHRDKLTAEQQEQFDKFTVMVKWKEAGERFKPGEVIAQVQKALGNLKVERPNGAIDKFNTDTHKRCWRRYEARPPTGAANPAATNKQYCEYDKAHKDYVYTSAWIQFLTEKMKDDAEYAALFV